MGSPSEDVTRLLKEWREGSKAAADRLLPLIQRDLAVRAAGFLRRERADHTLETQALVNEAYLRLVDQRRVQWQDRGHFFAVAAQSMRRILVDHARRRAMAKRGGGVQPVELNDMLPAPARSADLVALDQALERLAGRDEEKARIVELRFFAGLSNPQIAEALGVSLSTVERQWRLARAWLHRDLGAGDPADPP